jgi:hypothetical protein
MIRKTNPAEEPDQPKEPETKTEVSKGGGDAPPPAITAVGAFDDSNLPSKRIWRRHAYTFNPRLNKSQIFVVVADTNANSSYGFLLRVAFEKPAQKNKLDDFPGTICKIAITDLCRDLHELFADVPAHNAMNELQVSSPEVRLSFIGRSTGHNGVISQYTNLEIGVAALIELVVIKGSIERDQLITIQGSVMHFSLAAIDAGLAKTIRQGEWRDLIETLLMGLSMETGQTLETELIEQCQERNTVLRLHIDLMYKGAEEFEIEKFFGPTGVIGELEASMLAKPN